MRLLLSEILPLRTTQILGDFKDTHTLPHRYGDLTSSPFPLIRMTDSKFFAADHPMEILRVFADEQETQGWARAIETDSTGHTFTVVLLTAPAPDNVVMSAAGNGKLNPSTGALLENPADLMEDVVRIAGRSEIFPQLRAESSKAGLVLAGSIGEDDPLSIRATLDLIALSAAAIWTPSGSRLYPTATVAGPVIELTKMEASGLSVNADLNDTADILDLFYDQNDASGQTQRFMRLEASPQRFGGIIAAKTYPMIRTPANAEAVGRRALARMAGRRFTVTYSANRTDIRPGAWVRLVDNPEWPTPDANPQVMTLAVDVTPDTSTTVVTGECVLSSPAITVTAHSIAVPPTAGAAIQVDVTNGNATFKITDKDGQPLRNARVSFDGSPPKTTDAQGTVEFPYQPGAHKLAVEAPGVVPFVMDFLL